MLQRLPFLYIASSALHGRGVFTAEPIKAGDMIEICPVIVLPPEELEIIHNSSLHDYYFLWGPNADRPAIALGYGSIYNHHCPANANFEYDFESMTIDFFCVRDIEPGEEITINYNGDPEDDTPVWFQRSEQKKLPLRSR